MAETTPAEPAPWWQTPAVFLGVFGSMASIFGAVWIVTRVNTPVPCICGVQKSRKRR